VRLLRAYPTLAEIDTLENYIFATRRISLNTLRAKNGGWPIAVATFATHYRNASNSVGGTHAQLCFSRTGICRIGNLAPLYDPRLRNFIGFDDHHPFAFHVVPRRFSAYLAVQMPGDSALSAGVVPQDRLDTDAKRQFWVPLHKLFDGPECIAGMNLRVVSTRGMLNDQLAVFHRFLESEGLQNNWSGADLEQYPFVIRDEKIASLSPDRQYGPSVLVPRPSAMVEEAHYKGARLTFPVDPRYAAAPGRIQMSSMFVLPGAEVPLSPKYLDDAEQMTARPAPQYINVRHHVVDGEIDNLNDHPDMLDIIRRGNYQAQHYLDGSGDGWVASTCPELARKGIAVSRPAFAMVSLPDFLPGLSQRELMLWWNGTVPAPLRDTLWGVPPLALSQTRIAGNVELPGNRFSIDDTVSAIVSLPQGLDGAPPSGATQVTNGALRMDKVGLPDGAAGLFDPGWDGSMGVRRGPDGMLMRFLASHGLGSPFLEDAKICAALGSYWPGSRRMPRASISPTRSSPASPTHGRRRSRSPTRNSAWSR
jgi:hypothetical protein